MKNFKHISLVAVILLAACIVSVFTVNAAGTPTVSFDEIHGLDTGNLSSDGFSATLSTRESVKGGKDMSDLRIVIVADQALLNANRDAVLTVSLGGKSFSYSVVNELSVFKTATAAGVNYVTESGYVLTGFVLTQVPDWAWTTITVTLSTSDANYSGTLTLQEVVSHKTIGAFGSKLSFKNDISELDYEPAAVIEHSTVVNMLNNQNYTMKVRYNGELYTLNRFSNSGSYVRASLADTGIQIVNGESYTMSFILYDASGNLCWYSDELTATADMQYAHISLPKSAEKVNGAGLPFIEGEAGTWDGNAANIMDGSADSRWLINAGDDQTVKIYFATEKPEVLTYYSYYTHNEASGYPDRQSASWVLYGRLSTEDEWVKLDEVESYLNQIKKKGIGFSFAVDTPTLCQEYMMELTVQKKSQGYYNTVVADIELYTDESIAKSYYVAPVDTASVAVSNLSTWGDSPIANFFDGNTVSSKMGGYVSGGSLTVEFSLTSATSLAYYTLYTGGDTKGHSSRNPSGWTLYGKANGAWVEIDDVATSTLKAANSAAFGYAIDKDAPVCKDYKIVFKTGGSFQMNELMLYCASPATVSDYVVVYDDSSESLTQMAKSFTAKLNRLFGVDMACVGISSAREPYAKEILIGDLSLSRSVVSAVKANCTASDFAIAVEGDDVVLYATDDVNYAYMFSVFYGEKIFESINGEFTCVAEDDFYYHSSAFKDLNHLQYQYETLSNFTVDTLRGHFTYHTVTKANGEKMVYRLYVPSNYDPSKEYPLIVVLHGAGERGADNESQFGNLIFHLFNHNNSPIQDAIVILPQCPSGNQWVDTPWANGNYSTASVKESDELQAVVQVIGELQSTYSVDDSRIYAMGLSMGGFGTWDLLMRHGDLFAAGIPICGGADPTKAAELAKIPIRTFHSKGDGVVPATGTQAMAVAINAANPVDFKYTEFSDSAHDCWTRVGQDLSNLEWLFAQKKAN